MPNCRSFFALHPWRLSSRLIPFLRIHILLTGSLLVGLVSLGGSIAGEVRADDDLDFFPGLVARLTTASGTMVRRIDRHVRISAQESTPDIRLDGPLSAADWSGYLMSQNPGPYRLAAFAAGKVRVQVAGETIISSTSDQATWTLGAPRELEFDWHPLKVHFEPASDDAELSLYWSGPGFSWEPLSPRQLYHDPEATVSDAFTRGATLARALRCQACHRSERVSQGADPKTIPGPPAEILPAPSLGNLDGRLHASWLNHWLAAAPAASTTDSATSEADQVSRPDQTIDRTMPYFELSRQEQMYLRQFLLPASTAKERIARIEGETVRESDSPESRVDETELDGLEYAERLEQGRTLLLTLGCLACHEYGTLGQSGLFGGGDLTAIADKRPASFFSLWLTEPEQINPHHRMPVYSLEEAQGEALATFLGSLKASAANIAVADDGASTGESFGRASRESPTITPSPAVRTAETALDQGRAIFERYRCGACHEGPRGEEPAARIELADELTAQSAWSQSCAGAVPPAATAPAYALAEADRDALHAYYSSLPPRSQPAPADEDRSDSSSVEPFPVVPATHLSLEQRLLEHNCVACHARDDHEGLAARLPELAERYPRFAEQLPALTPPSLNGVGDKLRDEVLREVVAGRSPVHRPWLHVRMPRFALSDAELDRLVQGLIDADRIPAGLGQVDRSSAWDSTETARHIGARLVTADGFGCTSCHAVGRVQPPQGPLNTLGPDLALLERRVRRPWFDRWVRNPARIVPRMEMPSVQTAVPGVLGDDLDAQLAAVWRTLNEPNFRPPAPNPVRTVRRSAIAEDNQRAALITEVAKVGETTYIKPILVGLPNRHNVLLDLEENRLAHWWLGDTARQRTLGKTWFWELGSPDLASLGRRDIAWQLQLGDEFLAPDRRGQFLTEFDELRHIRDGIELRHRLIFSAKEKAIVPRVVQRFLGAVGENRWIRELEVKGIPAGGKLLVHLVGSESLERIEERAGSSTRFHLDTEHGVWLELLGPDPPAWDREGRIVLTGNSAGAASARIAYATRVPVDVFPRTEAEEFSAVAETLAVVPGFAATRLPLSRELMPTGFAWDSAGNLIVSSFKGRVWRAIDRSGDGLEDKLEVVSDNLAAPYGLAAGDGYLDVTTRDGLLRLLDQDGDGFHQRVVTLYSGWGHTDDYHDWTVGLPRDKEGNYYIALACQQDERSPEAARMRGTVLRLTPKEPTSEDPHLFAAEVMSIGHRFPMGIARNRRGDLFTTDNQGNYKPFNELNHVKWGADYGFINALDRPTADKRGPTEPPAVEIPHPWTRSVNGICFLETPAELSQATPYESDRGEQSDAMPGHFGPFEGHLIGCEYDTRRLIRMSLQRVGDAYQGAAYPFSLYEPIEGPTFLGPLVCQVSPEGDLVVGCIRDSGWGGANNIGGIVKLSIEPDRIPAGIAEVQVRATGFEIRLTRPVPRELAEDPANYSLASYRRTATPAYGGPDQDRRQERIRRVEVDTSGQRVFLQLDSLREGFVYELHVRNLAGAGKQFFPAEAHYTLRHIPSPTNEPNNHEHTTSN